MQKTRNLLALVVSVGLMAVWGHVFAAGETTKVSPVLDRILAKKELIVGTAASMPHQYPVMTEFTNIDDPTRLSPKPQVRADLPNEFTWRDYLGGDYTTTP